MPVRRRRNPIRSTKAEHASPPDDEEDEDELDADDDEEDEEDDDEDGDDDEPEAEAGAAPAGPLTGAGGAATSDPGAASPPAPRVVKVPGRSASPWDPPPESVYVKVLRKEGLSFAPCGQLMPTGEVKERFTPTSPSPESILATWGSGTYNLVHFGASDDGTRSPIVGKRNNITLEHPDHPQKPRVYRVPPPAPPPQRAPAPPREPPPTPAPQTSELVELIKQAQSPEANPLVTLLLMQEMAERKAMAARERDREDYRLQLERERASHTMALETERERHRRQLEEDDARHRRELEHTTTLSRELIRSSNAATGVAELRQELEALAEDIDNPPDNRPNLVEQLLPVVQPIVEMVLANKKAKALTPA